MAVVLSDPERRDCSPLPVQRRGACCLLAFLIFPAGSEQRGWRGKFSSSTFFTDLNRSPSTNPENWVKLSKPLVCHGIPAPYPNAFAVLKGCKQCLSKLEQTLLGEPAGRSSRYTVSKHSSVNLISSFSCLLHIFSIGSFCRENGTTYFVG